MNQLVKLPLLFRVGRRLGKGITRLLSAKLCLEITELFWQDGQVVSLVPENKSRGNVLLAYIIEPFLLQGGESIPNTHTHYWESMQIARTFLNLGYSIDVISYRNSRFVPRKKYSIYVNARTNFEAIARRLNRDCLKIVHLDTSHWLFNNTAAYNRYLALQQRKKAVLEKRKIFESSWAIEHADCATLLGNEFTVSTYAYAGKPIYCVPVPASTVFPWPQEKDFARYRKNFLWLGSLGFVNKGLDLVLEVFSEIPDFQLTVCGPMHQEKAFEALYHKELYQTPNIKTLGWIDVTSEAFYELTKTNIGLIYPSCAEGQAGAVVNCMQTGLIPIISYESGVSVQGFGEILPECSKEQIKNKLLMISECSGDELAAKSRKAWEYARAFHTRENYAREYKKIIEQIITDRDRAVCCQR